MKMKQMNKWMLASILMLSGLTTLTSCSKDEENVEKTAEVVRSDGATLTFDIDGTPCEVRTADITVAKTPAAVRLRMAGKRD